MSPGIGRTAVGVVVICAGVALSLAALLEARPEHSQLEPEEAFFPGHFLVASSGIGDARFSRSVILLVEHNSEGALGFVVNLPARQMLLADLFARTAVETPSRDTSIRLHYGGPVRLEAVFVLHSPEVATESTRSVIDGLSLSTDAGMLELIGAGRGPDRYRILQGYSGWGPGQLGRELELGAWLHLPATAAGVFEVEPAELWDVLMKGHRL